MRKTRRESANFYELSENERPDGLRSMWPFDLRRESGRKRMASGDRRGAGAQAQTNKNPPTQSIHRRFLDVHKLARGVRYPRRSWSNAPKTIIETISSTPRLEREIPRRLNKLPECWGHFLKRTIRFRQRNNPGIPPGLSTLQTRGFIRRPVSG